MRLLRRDEMQKAIRDEMQKAIRDEMQKTSPAIKEQHDTGSQDEESAEKSS